MSKFGHKKAAISDPSLTKSKKNTIAIKGIFPIKIKSECKFNNF
jgi:hypothetical protein